MSFANCCCASVSCTVTVTVNASCGGRVAGAAVVVKTQADVVVASGTANSSGQFQFTLTAAAVYKVTATATGYLAFASNSVTLDCTTHTSFTFTMTVNTAGGYRCTPDGCCPSGAQSGPPYPTLSYSNLFLNDGFGLVPLTLNGGSWNGTALRTASQTIQPNADNSLCVATGSASVRVSFAFSCNAGSGWLLNIAFDGCVATAAGTQCAGDGSRPGTNTGCAVQGNSSSVTAASGCPPAFAWSGTVNFPTLFGNPVAGSYVYGSSASCTVSQ